MKVKRHINQQHLRAEAAERQQQIVIGIAFMKLQTASDLFPGKPDFFTFIVELGSRKMSC